MAQTFDPALRRPRKVDLCEFKAVVVNIASFRLASAKWQDPISNSSPQI